MGPSDVDPLLRTVIISVAIVATILTALALGIAVGVTIFGSI